MKRALLLILCIALLLPCLSGCGDTEPLQVWTADGTHEFSNRAVYIEQTINDRFECDVTVFANEGSAAEFMATTEELQSQLMAGEGPDLILFTERQFGDVRKLVESGCFMDLSGYLENSETYHPEDFVEGIMQDGYYGDSCFYVPLGYSYYSVLVPSFVLEENGWEGAKSAEELLQQAEAFAQNPGEYDRMFAHTAPPEGDEVFIMLFETAGLELVDDETGEVLPDEDGLRRFLEVYKGIWESQWKNCIGSGGLGYHGFWGDYTRERNFCYYLMNYTLPSARNYMLLINELEAHYTVVQDLYGTVSGEVTVYAAVNTYSRNSEQAWQLVERMLSEDMQMYIWETTTFLMPIRKGCIARWMREFPKEHENSTVVETREGMHYGYQAIDEELITEYAALAESAVARNNSPAVMQMLWDAMQPYFEGTDSYENCLEELRGRLEIYAGE
ncbi:MAG: carbohydrate ABC transporter substrate-binding protein [Oscillospiraceae bacterium]|nr:carbohydrate ABC transporter substrate-binding protein [Oscillospiraceae bacterium]